MLRVKREEFLEKAYFIIEISELNKVFMKFMSSEPCKDDNSKVGEAATISAAFNRGSAKLTASAST